MLQIVVDTHIASLLEVKIWVETWSIFGIVVPVFKPHSVFHNFVTSYLVKNVNIIVLSGLRVRHNIWS